MTLVDVFNLIKDNWDSLMIVVVAAGMLVEAIKRKANKEALMIALEMVRQVAVRQLSGVEKRKAVVDEVYKRMPEALKKFITKDEVESVVEKSYQLLRGEIKAFERGEIPVADFVKNVDPTQPMVYEENLRVSAPLDSNK